MSTQAPKNVGEFSFENSDDVDSLSILTQRTPASWKKQKSESSESSSSSHYSEEDGDWLCDDDDESSEDIPDVKMRNYRNHLKRKYESNEAKFVTLSNDLAVMQRNFKAQLDEQKKRNDELSSKLEALTAEREKTPDRASSSNTATLPPPPPPKPVRWVKKRALLGPDDKIPPLDLDQNLNSDETEKGAERAQEPPLKRARVDNPIRRENGKEKEKEKNETDEPEFELYIPPAHGRYQDDLENHAFTKSAYDINLRRFFSATFSKLPIDYTAFWQRVVSPTVADGLKKIQASKFFEPGVALTSNGPDLIFRMAKIRAFAQMVRHIYLLEKRVRFEIEGVLSPLSLDLDRYWMREFIDKACNHEPDLKSVCYPSKEMMHNITLFIKNELVPLTGCTITSRAFALQRLSYEKVIEFLSIIQDCALELLQWFPWD